MKTFPSLQLDIDSRTEKNHVSGDLVGRMGEFYGRVAGINGELAAEMIRRYNEHGEMVGALRLIEAYLRDAENSAAFNEVRAALAKFAAEKEQA
jgi:hypothetical protein